MSQVLLERAAARRRQPVLGPREAAVERLVAGDVLRLFELARVDAQVAVRGPQQSLQIVERQPVVRRQRADDAETQPLVNEAIQFERAASGRGDFRLSILDSRLSTLDSRLWRAL